VTSRKVQNVEQMAIDIDPEQTVGAVIPEGTLTQVIFAIKKYFDLVDFGLSL